jgi:O-antigen ligase
VVIVETTFFSSINKATKIFLIVLVGVLVGIPVAFGHTLIFGLAGVTAFGYVAVRLFRIRVIDLVIILLPISFYLRVGITINSSFADFLTPVLFVILLSVKYKSFLVEYLKQHASLIRYAFLLITAISASVIHPLFFGSDPASSLPNIIKTAVSMMYLLCSLCFFSYDFQNNNYRILKVWNYTALCFSVLCVVGNILFTMGLDLGITYGNRAKGTFEDPNLAASYLILSLSIAVMYNQIFKKKVFGMNILIILTALLFTASRGGVLGLCIGSAIVFILTFKVKNLVKLAFVSLLALSILAPLIYAFDHEGAIVSSLQTSYERVTNVDQDETGTQYRVLLWETAYQMWKGNPIFGVGTGQYMNNTYKIIGVSLPNIPHNTYLTYLAETGVLGLLILLWKPVQIIFQTLNRSRKKDAIASILLVGLVSFAVQAFTVNLENFRVFWVFLALCIAWNQSPSNVSSESR